MVTLTIMTFVAACLLSGILTHLLCRVAPSIGLVDAPDGYRKTHGRTVPLGGGLAVFVSLVIVLIALLVIPSRLSPAIYQGPRQLLSLLLAAGVIVCVGLLDDRFKLRGRQKLVGQLIAVSVLLVGGFLIQRISFLGIDIDLGLLAIPFSLFWLLGAINALNLLDGVDGFATTVGLVLVAAIAAMAGMTGRHDVSVVAITLAGCLLGFLRFNLPPARIFLGDAGSMLIGVFVGALSIQSSLKSSGTVLLAAPLAILAIPILDSLAAVIRRKLTGRSVYATDRGHIHHRLLNRLRGRVRVLVWVGISCVVTSLAALGSVFLKNDLVAIVTCGAVVCVFIVADLFGRAELLLIARQVRAIGRSLVPQIQSTQSNGSHSALRIQGSHRWDPLWNRIASSAQELGFTKVAFDVSVPAVHEHFNAVWDCLPDEERQYFWQVEVPLMSGNESVGRLTIAGIQNGESARNYIERTLTLIDVMHEELPAVWDKLGCVAVVAPVIHRGSSLPEPLGATLVRMHPK